MKIALLGTRGIPPRYGGTEVYVEQLARYLAEQGDEVLVYCQKLPHNRSHVLYSPNIRRIEISSIPTKHLDNLTRTMLSAIHVCFKRDVEVVQFNNVGPCLFSFLPWLFGKKIVGAIRAIDSKREKWNWLASAFLRACERICLIFSHATTVNSISMKDYYKKKYKAVTYYISNGVQVPERRAIPQRILEWGLQKRNYILFAARLEPEKGCHTLISAYKKLFEQGNPALRLAIAGHKGHSKKYVEELQRSATDQIIFLGYISGEVLQELFSNAFAFVLPSSVEGMSNSLLLAMAYGIPTVVSDIPENLAVINDAPYNVELGEKPGLSFGVGDSDELAHQLSRLIDDPQGAKKRGAALQSYVSANFNVDKMGHQTRELYSRLL